MASVRSPSRVHFPVPVIVVALLLLWGCSDDAGVDSAPVAEVATTSPTTTAAPEASSTTVGETTTTPAPEADATAEPEPVIFADDFGASIAPIITGKCATCHNSGGPGAQRLVLDSVADVHDAAPLIGSYVGSGEMPPWPAGPLSVSFHDERGLSDDQRAAVLAWVEAGGEVDLDPSTPLPAEQGVVALDEIDAVLSADAPYAGSLERTDDYRCQIYDPGLSEATWLTGYNFVPDRLDVVHHAIGYLAPAEARERALARDAQDELPGWPCFGGSGIGEDAMLVGWAPGQGPTQFPDGAGVRLDPGDFIVMQVHYHYETEAPPDHSTMELDLTDGGAALDPIDVAQYIAPVEIPCAADQSGPLCDRDAAMAAAIEKYGRGGVRNDIFNGVCGVSPADFAHMTDGVASSSCDLPVYSFGEILAVLGHEHEIGATFRMTLNPDSPDELILLDIPDWDFGWQYNYRPLDSIILEPGDIVRVECSWDRSRQKPGVEPSYILWADGTNDEMCFSTIAVRRL